MRIVFMGTPELARVSLEALLAESSFQIVGVVTQPDRPSGRDLKVSPSPVKTLALSRGLLVLQPERARNEAFVDQLRTWSPELIVVAAYGQILPKSILDLPRYGCINVHTSLLPRYRGAAPIQWAILNGDAETGVTIMKMDEGMDTGAIISQQRTPISPEDNGQTLHDRLARLGAELLVRTIPDYVSGKLKPVPQPTEGITYTKKIKKEEGLIDWAQPARMVWNRVRGLAPWPGAFTRLPGTNELLKIWDARVVSESGSPGLILQTNKEGIVVACAEDALQVRSLQRPGGRRLSAQEFLAGNALSVGQSLRLPGTIVAGSEKNSKDE
jgi:methionyl-tRNA formyltransferase